MMRVPLATRLTYLAGTTRVLMDELAELLLSCTALLVFSSSLQVLLLHLVPLSVLSALCLACLCCHGLILAYLCCLLCVRVQVERTELASATAVYACVHTFFSLCPFAARTGTPAPSGLDGGALLGAYGTEEPRVGVSACSRSAFFERAGMGWW